MAKIKRPETIKGQTTKVVTACGSIYFTIGELDGEIYEIFPHAGKAGNCLIAQVDPMCWLVTAALQAGVDKKKIIKKLKGIGCHQHHKADPIHSCADALAQALERYELQTTKEPEAK